MNLSKVKLVRETPEAWHVHDGEREFAVAKHGLSPETHGAIAQHFADGGTAQPDPSNASSSFDPLEAMNSDNSASEYTRRPPEKDGIFDPALPPADNNAPAEQTPTAAQTPAPQQEPLPPDLPLAALPQKEAPAPRAPGADMSLSRQYNAASQEAQTAQRGIGDELSQKAARDAATMSALAADKEQQRQQTVQQLQDTITHQKTLIDGVASQRIDPNQFWNSRTTGQKVSATIGMIVGGFGAGFSGTGKNPAMDMINEAIGRDIDAQKANLSQANNRVKMYMDLGHSIQDAGKLAMADLSDVASAQLQSSAAKSDIVLNKLYGTKTAADMQMDNAKTRSAIVLNAYQTGLEANNLRQAQLNAPVQAAQRGNQMQLEDLRKHWLSGGALTMPQLQALGVIKSGEIVNQPGGGQSAALDEKSAEKVRDAQAELTPFRSALGQYKNLLASGNPSTIDRGQAKSLRDQLVIEMKGLTGVNRLTETELKKFEEMVPDISDIAKPYAAQKLERLQQELDQRAIGVNRAYLRQ